MKLTSLRVGDLVAIWDRRAGTWRRAHVVELAGGMVWAEGPHGHYRVPRTSEFVRRLELAYCRNRRRVA